MNTLINVLKYTDSILKDPDWKRKDAFELAGIKTEEEEPTVQPVRYFRRRAARHGNTTMYINKVNIHYK
jgi:hypothetical protein